MRRDHFSLKIMHVVQFLKEEYEEWSAAAMCDSTTAVLAVKQLEVIFARAKNVVHE